MVRSISAGVAQEALEIIMHSDCSSSSSVDSEADTEEASEVGTDQLESSSDSSEERRGDGGSSRGMDFKKWKSVLVSHKH
ncbi:Protein XA-1 [Dissostichus eleginoides]|uniref:Protein XA-1 n=1 Tax=Dissostichus eleginoides TaxID=100907 RepID=A0AAD9ERZ5_DISEL|nr:Protein XA-1 [Dissostichus eleginoides]